MYDNNSFKSDMCETAIIRIPALPNIIAIVSSYTNSVRTITNNIEKSNIATTLMSNIISFFFTK